MLKTIELYTLNWVNYVVCELYLNKTICLEKALEGQVHKLWDALRRKKGGKVVARPLVLDVRKSRIVPQSGERVTSFGLLTGYRRKGYISPWLASIRGITFCEGNFAPIIFFALRFPSCQA